MIPSMRWRRPRLLSVLIACTLVSLALGALLHSQRDHIRDTLAHWTGEEDLVEQLKGTAVLALLRFTRRPPQTDPYAPIEHTGIPPYGVNTFLEQEVESEKVDRSLAMISEAGFHWIRQQFPWEDIEISGKGDYWDHKWDVSAWAKYDRIVELAEKHDLGIIARLDNPPAWSRAMGDEPGWSLAPPDRYDDYGDFVYAVVSRYRGRIRYYQIWNEPNIYPEWGDQPADPEAYTELLKIAYRRAKQADPDCVIIAAGLAQTTEEAPLELGPRNISDLLYLERMYEAGVQGHFDIMGAMVYGLWTGPYDRRASRDRTNFARVELLREIMVRHGDAAKPIWATEAGWTALPEDWEGPMDYGRVDELQQARYTVQAYERARREWPWMGVLNYWFFRRPSDAEMDQSWYYFRMVEPDFETLPAYNAISEIANGCPLVPIGYHQEDHWALNYAGSWERREDASAVLGAYMLGTEGDEVTFVFEGTGLTLVLRDAAQRGHLEITVDDAPATLQPSGDRGLLGAGVDVVRGLPDGTHQVRIVATQGEVALDGLLVSRHRESLWAWLLGLGAASVGFCGLYFGWRARREHAGST